MQLHITCFFVRSFVAQYLIMVRYSYKLNVLSELLRMTALCIMSLFLWGPEHKNCHYFSCVDRTNIWQSKNSLGIIPTTVPTPYYQFLIIYGLPNLQPGSLTAKIVLHWTGNIVTADTIQFHLILGTLLSNNTNLHIFTEECWRTLSQGHFEGNSKLHINWWN